MQITTCNGTDMLGTCDNFFCCADHCRYRLVERKQQGATFSQSNDTNTQNVFCHGLFLLYTVDSCSIWTMFIKVVGVL